MENIDKMEQVEAAKLGRGLERMAVPHTRRTWESSVHTGEENAKE